MIKSGSYIFYDEWKKSSGSHFKELFAQANSEKEKETVRIEARKDLASFFKPIYRRKLNECINLRYRNTGFDIVYVLLDGEPLSDIIEPHAEDRAIYVGMDATTHRTKMADVTYPYPNQDYILNQLGLTNHLRIGGFHVWDCVEKLAKRAHERRIDVLVDEDLTDLFVISMKKREFDPSRYPSINPRLEGEEYFENYMGCRRGVPWLWQDYAPIACWSDSDERRVQER